MKNHYEKKKVTSLFDECFCFDCKSCEDTDNDSELSRLCKKCCHKHNEKPCFKNSPLIKDNICGNITSPCDGTLTTLWRTTIPSTFGTVSIFYGNGCGNLNVYINDTFAFMLEKGQTQSITVSSLQKVAVKCNGGTGFCSGKYCIDIHYEKPRGGHNDI